MRKLLIITTLLTTACVPAITTVGIYKASQAANLATGGNEAETLTQNSYDRCKAGKGGCIESGIYTAAFLPVDAPLAVLMGKPELIGSHGATWEAADKLIPTISHVRKDGYGGSKWIEFLPKRR